jgi:Domain of unknown function (DUF4160)
MPVVLRIEGFAFSFFAGDHEPPHVHVAYGGDECRVALDTLELGNSTMKANDERRALRLVATHRVALAAAWVEFQRRKVEN